MKHVVEPADLFFCCPAVDFKNSASPGKKEKVMVLTTYEPPPPPMSQLASHALVLVPDTAGWCQMVTGLPGKAKWWSKPKATKRKA